MPHLTIEYSANLESRVTIADVVAAIHQAAIETGLFPIGGIRTRAVRRDHYVIADGDPDNAFVHLVARIGHGRDEEARRQITDRLFGALCDVLDEAFSASPLAVSFDLEEMNPRFSRRKNNLHDRLRNGAKGSST
ncbi:MAG: 5-carboxymethyl-2-hydroxymuconate Delta-isomerase [Alphaproteobacteria bacterium]|nr:MAG: 5-carboxymethyl-2-hydroxymuconate Delta-isomerase [Alphaproteobacteria bacterium]